MRAQAYRNLRTGTWSVRSGGRVVARPRTVVMSGCRMIVREAARQQILRGGHRSVHAWVDGIIEKMDCTIRVPVGAVRFGYSPRCAGTFTIRPGYAPIHQARLVILADGGVAYAVLIQED